jgi:hypothetical protein
MKIVKRLYFLSLFGGYIPEKVRRSRYRASHGRPPDRSTSTVSIANLINKKVLNIAEGGVLPPLSFPLTLHPVSSDLAVVQPFLDPISMFMNLLMVSRNQTFQPTYQRNFSTEEVLITD